MDINNKFYDELTDIIELFISKSNAELEAKCQARLNGNDINNILKYLRSLPEDYIEEIHPNILDVTFDKGIRGSTQKIEEYCRTSDISLFDSVITKKKTKGANQHNFVKSLEFSQMHSCIYKIDIREETPIEKYKVVLKDKAGIFFRLKKRFSYVSTSKDVRIDITCVKQGPILCLLASNPLEYELEIEVLREKNQTKNTIAKNLIETMVEVCMVKDKKDVIFNPDETISVINEYIDLVYPGKNKNTNDIYTSPKKYFIGPQPVTLEKKNTIQQEFDLYTVPCILKDYTVTEKADGERMLLFINNIGNVYLINNRLNVIPLKCKVTNLKKTVIDGEFIRKDKLGQDIQLFASFDIYWFNGDDVCNMPLIGTGVGKNSRLDILQSAVKKIKCKEAKITVKDFKYGDSIFSQCKEILESNEYVYKTDGLIFTPKYLAVGAIYPGMLSIQTPTWACVMKWKPPEENTIDFLVKINPNNKTVIDNKTFKVLDLFVGYNPLQWEKINLKDYIRMLTNGVKPLQTYIPRSFINEGFSVSNIEINNENDVLKCLDGGIIEDNSIVEFKYSNGWIPIRLREDKTSLYKITSTISGTANDYKTATQIWNTIQNPITYDMICGLSSIEDKQDDDDDIYYNRRIERDNLMTIVMNKYHNAVKESLIKKVSDKKTSLFDLACGKGGDLNKWIKSGYKTVVGVDISSDNIENPIDGIFKRSLDMYESNRQVMQNYAFTTMDSSKCFKEENLTTPESKFLWGITNIPEYPVNMFGIANKTFDTVSCQFSIHYFYKNEDTLDNFVWNVNKLLSKGGSFIGTYLDGFLVKEKIKSNASIEGRSKQRINNSLTRDVTLWKIKRKYDTSDNSPPNIGDEIEVYMESIGKTSIEYLVNLDILTKKLAHYSIVKVENNAFTSLLPHTNKFKMTPPVLEYSKMNKYFIYTKK